MHKTHPEPKIKAVKRSFDIVEALADIDGATAVDMADHFDMPLSTTFDHLQTLEVLGYIIKRGDEYQIGSKFLKLANVSRYNREICIIAKQVLDKLARKTGEHSVLMFEENGYGVSFYIAEGETSDVPLIVRAGSRTMLHSTAPGKVILAHETAERVDQIINERGLPSITENTITDRGELIDHLSEIEDQGYGLDMEESLKGLYGLATPVLRREDGTILATIGIYSLLNENKEIYIDEILPHLQKATNTIELHLANDQDRPAFRK